MIEFLKENSQIKGEGEWQCGIWGASTRVGPGYDNKELSGQRIQLFSNGHIVLLFTFHP